MLDETEIFVVDCDCSWRHSPVKSRDDAFGKSVLTIDCETGGCAYAWAGANESGGHQHSDARSTEGVTGNWRCVRPEDHRRASVRQENRSGSQEDCSAGHVPENFFHDYCEEGEIALSD